MHVVWCLRRLMQGAAAWARSRLAGVYLLLLLRTHQEWAAPHAQCAGPGRALGWQRKQWARPGLCERRSVSSSSSGGSSVYVVWM